MALLLQTVGDALSSTTSSLAIPSRTARRGYCKLPLSLKKGMVGSYSTPKDVQTSAISDAASTLITSMR